MKKHHFSMLIALLCLGAAPAPKLSIVSLAQLPIVTMHPYNESANANLAVTAAFARAKTTHKQVLLDLGGNWCADCIVLANFLELPEMNRFMSQHYELVMVDVGRFDKNQQVAARFGLTQRLEGVPTVLVASSDGKLMNAGHVFAFTDASHMTPKALASYLAMWAK